MLPSLTARSRRALARAAAVALVLGSGLVGTAATASSAAAAPADCTGGGSVAVVAHPDDDLFFMSPDVSADVVAGVCTTTVYVTSGDAGSSDGYVTARERGVEAAYATTAAVADRWTVTTTTIAGHAVELHVLDALPTVRLVFMGLPDGFPDGSGSERSGWTSLQKLYLGGIPSITTLDGSSTYTRAELVRTLGALITASGADRVRTLDYEGAFGDGDHGDHHAVARLVVEARAAAAPRTGLAGYLGYSSAARPANVTGAALEAKWSALLAYARFDPLMCSTRAACDARPEGSWMPRSYVLAGAVPAPTATTTPTTAPTTTGPTTTPTTAPTTTAPTSTAPTPAPTTTGPTTTGPTTTGPTTTGPTTTAPVSVEVAGTGVVTASSQNAADSQTAVKAVDGVVSGYPGDWTAEWATAGGRAGSWWQEVYPRAVTVDRVVLFDRPNTDDRVTGATVTFSDGTSVAVGALADDGSATALSFPARSTTSVRVTVTSVSATTRNVGLSEVQLWTPAGTAATATPTTAPTAAPTTTAPTTTAPTTAPTTTAPTTSVPTTSAPVSVEVAGTGLVTASSQNAADSQTAAKAVDGVVSGYPGDWTAEWATAGGRAGSWWQEVYPRAVTVDRVVLFDRPNTSDRVTAATLTFSDGTSVRVGALKDDGSATTFSFPARSTTSLRVALTTVSSTTRNAGLSEVQLWTAAR